MSFLIKDIFELDFSSEWILIAGKKGIYNEIVWINMMEILDQFDSLQKNEFLLTTGYALNEKYIYQNLIQNLKLKGLAGIGIQPGYYIDKIPEYIIEAGNKYNFPVIQIPKKVTFSSITRTLLKNIYNIRFNETSTSELEVIKNKLFEMVKFNKDIFEGDLANNYLFLLSVSHMDDGIITDVEICDSSSHLKAYFDNIGVLTHAERSGRKILFIVSLHKNISLQTIIYDITNLLTLLSKKYTRLSFTIGSSSLSSIENLPSAFNEAISSLQMLEKAGVHKGLCQFENIGLFNLLGILNSSVYSKKFAYDTLNPIIEYDIKNNSNYLDTLKLFLINNCSINSTAEKLMIHRHTLKNRIEKIGALCNADFYNYYVRMRFYASILINDFFS